MKLTKDKIKCTCGKWATPKTFNVEGFEVRGWQCPKCKRIEYSDDINTVLMIKKLQKEPLTVKVGQLGSSKIIRLPKELEKIFKTAKGRKVRVYPTSTNKIAVEA